MNTKIFILTIAMSLFAMNCESSNQVRDIANIEHLTSTDNVSMSVVYEYDELDGMSEGIYLLKAKLGDPDMSRVVANIRANTNPENQCADGAGWLESGSDFDVDDAIFNYQPLPDEASYILSEIKTVLVAGGNLAWHCSDSSSTLLYVVSDDTSTLYSYHLYH